MTSFAEGAESLGELAPRGDFGIGASVAAAEARDKLFDAVSRPAHYASGAIECADAIEAALNGETDPVVAWARGNALKYLWRTGKKDDPVQDLEKAIWYCARAAQRIRRREGRADAA